MRAEPSASCGGRLRAAVAVLLATLVTACTADGRPAAETSLEAGSTVPAERFVEYVPPPLSVPDATLEAVELQPAHYSWRLDGMLRTMAPESDARVVTNDVRLDDTPGLEFVLHAPVEPLVTQLLLYPDPSEGRIPDPDDAETVDCFAAPSCAVAAAPDGTVRITYSGATDDVAIAVLYVEYGTSEQIDIAEDVGAYRASWVSKIVGP